MSRKYQDLVFRELFWPRPFEFSAAENFAKSLVTFSHSNPIVWEVRGHNHGLRFFLGGERSELARLKELLKIHGHAELGKALEATDEARGKLDFARELNFSHTELSFKTDENELLTRSALAVLAGAGPEDTLVFQMVLGRSFAPSLAPEKFQKPHPSVWQILSGIPEATRAEKDALKEKFGFAKMNVSVRIAAGGKNASASQYLLRGLFSSLRLVETGGVRLRQKSSTADAVTLAKIPLRFNSRLSVPELANLFLLPAGEANFRGVRDLHPKIMLPPEDYVSSPSRSFAESLNQNPEDRKLLNLPMKQALKHLQVIGPTGAGKSVILENLALADAREGRGLIVIDPKYSLVQSIAEKLPENRLNDVIIIDPTAVSPVGINPFSYVDKKSPELAAEMIITSLKALIPDFGIYSEKMLTSAILTLARNEHSTLLHLPLLFSNEAFRKRMTAGLDDLYLRRFWQDFENLSESERRMQVTPLLNRLEPLQVRQSLVGILGQEKPKFDLRDIFEKNKILLVPLNSGLVGKEVSEFLASLVIGIIWDLTLKRASIPEEKRRPVGIIIDEFQNYLRKSSSDIEEMLALSRGLGLAFTFAHQNLGQISRDIKETIMSNARSKICFGLAKWDAREFAMLSESLEESDFLKLPQYQIYTKLETEHGSTDFISGKAFPPSKSLRDPIETFARSAKNYGGDRKVIEAEMEKLLNETEEFSGMTLTRQPNYQRHKEEK